MFSSVTSVGTERSCTCELYCRISFSVSASLVASRATKIIAFGWALANCFVNPCGFELGLLEHRFGYQGSKAYPCAYSSTGTCNDNDLTSLRELILGRIDGGIYILMCHPGKGLGFDEVVGRE